MRLSHRVSIICGDITDACRHFLETPPPRRDDGVNPAFALTLSLLLLIKTQPVTVSSSPPSCYITFCPSSLLLTPFFCPFPLSSLIPCLLHFLPSTSSCPPPSHFHHLSLSLSLRLTPSRPSLHIFLPPSLRSSPSSPRSVYPPPTVSLIIQYNRSSRQKLPTQITPERG